MYVKGRPTSKQKRKEENPDNKKEFYPPVKSVFIQKRRNEGDTDPDPGKTFLPLKVKQMFLPNQKKPIG